MTSRFRLPSLKAAAGIFAVLVMVWLVAAAYQSLVVFRSASEARGAVEELRGSMSVGSLLSGESREQLVDAQLALQRLNSDVSSRVLGPARLMPFVGRQLKSAEAISGAGATIVGVVLDAGDEASELATGDSLRANSSRLATLESLGELLGSADARLRSIDLGPQDGLVGPLVRARNEIALELTDGLGDLERGRVVVDGLRDMLAGPRTYLLGAANNAEMRAGQGAMLSVGVLSTSGGAVFVTEMTPVWERIVGEPVALVDGDHDQRWGWLTDGQDWLLTSMTPRFPVNAELAMRMWQAAGEPEVDGVIVVDPFVLRAVLEVTGPVESGDRTIDAGNVLDLLLNEQYLGVEFDDLEQFGRRERLSDVAPSVLRALFERDIDLVDVAESLSAVVESRHFLAWSPGEDAGLWGVLGVEGRLSGDSLLLSLINRGPNKLDYFTYVESTIGIERVGADTAVEVQVAITNRSYAGLPRYVAGPILGSPTPAGYYRGIITLNVPGAAMNSRIDGVSDLTVVGADGPTRVVGTEVLIAPGDTQVVTFRFELPTSVESLRVEGSARYPVELWNVPEGRVVGTGQPFTLGF